MVYLFLWYSSVSSLVICCTLGCSPKVVCFAARVYHFLMQTKVASEFNDQTSHSIIFMQIVCALASQWLLAFMWRWYNTTACSHVHCRTGHKELSWVAGIETLLQRHFIHLFNYYNHLNSIPSRLPLRSAPNPSTLQKVSFEVSIESEWTLEIAQRQQRLVLDIGVNYLEGTILLSSCEIKRDLMSIPSSEERREWLPDARTEGHLFGGWPLKLNLCFSLGH